MSEADFKRPLYQYSGGCIDLSPACVEFVLFCLPSSGGGLAPDPRRMGPDRGRFGGLPAQQHLPSPLREIRGPRCRRDALRRAPRQPAPAQPLRAVSPITGVIVSWAAGPQMRGSVVRRGGARGSLSLLHAGLGCVLFFDNKKQSPLLS